jgi:hypothetical protein
MGNSQNTPSAEQIAQWEAKYGKIKKVVVNNNEGEDKEELVFYFKKIDLKTLRLAQNAISVDKDPIKYAEIVLRNSILNNSEYLEDSEVFLSLLPIVDKLLTSKIAVLEKN